jgi:hypothetical protein
MKALDCSGHRPARRSAGGCTGWLVARTPWSVSDLYENSLMGRFDGVPGVRLHGHHVRIRLARSARPARWSPLAAGQPAPLGNRACHGRAAGKFVRDTPAFGVAPWPRRHWRRSQPDYVGGTSVRIPPEIEGRSRLRRGWCMRIRRRPVSAALTSLSIKLRSNHCGSK